jgi:hypothetical protein
MPDPHATPDRAAIERENLVTRYATELVIQHDAKIAGLHDLLRRMIAETETDRG